jgi:hypothetical protein
MSMFYPSSTSNSASLRSLSKPWGKTFPALGWEDRPAEGLAEGQPVLEEAQQAEEQVSVGLLVALAVPVALAAGHPVEAEVEAVVRWEQVVSQVHQVDYQEAAVQEAGQDNPPPGAWDASC